MTTTLYTAAELSNERYHSEEFPQASGSILAKIYDTTPAEFRYSEPTEKKHFIDGIAQHVCVLEPVSFKNTYVRNLSLDDFPENSILVTNKDLERWIKEAGIKGYSNKDKTELIAMIDQTGETPPIWQRMLEAHAAANEGKIIISPDSYDMVLAMRSALKKLCGYVFTPEMQMEVSIIGESLKCRMDIIVPPGEMAPDGTITKNGEIWDLKSTTTVKPEKFGLQSEKCLYWLKMAIQHDLYVEHYGVAPDRVVLLAQSKTKPYLPQAFQLTKQQLEVGRDMYQGTLEIYNQCKANDYWPGYGGGVMELPTSGRAAYEFGMEFDDVEIVEDES